MKITAFKAAQLNELYQHLESIDDAIKRIKTKGATWNIYCCDKDGNELASLTPPQAGMPAVLSFLRTDCVAEINRLGGEAK